MASSIVATPSHTLSPSAALSPAKLGAAPPSLFLALSSHHSPFPSLTLSCPNSRFLVSIKQLTHRAVAGATAAELDDKEEKEEEEEEEEEKDDGSVTKGLAFTPPTKPKKGKAALPYKRDRLVDDLYNVYCPLERYLCDACLARYRTSNGWSQEHFIEHVTRSKRFLEIQKLRDWRKDHDVPSAIMLMKQMASTKFVESAEAHFRLNLDPKYADQQLRASVNLPKGTGQKVKVAVLATGEKLDEAEKAGADIFGADELIEKIKEGFMEFDKLIASPEMMPKVATLGRILGPRGLMPNPKAGTVSTDITQAINEFKKGKVEYRVDKTGIVHVLFGKVNFPDEDLIENFMEIVRSVETNKPKGAKGVYWRSAYICSTMGPSIRLNLKQMLEYKPPPSV